MSAWVPFPRALRGTGTILTLHEQWELSSYTCWVDSTRLLHHRGHVSHQGGPCAQCLHDLRIERDCGEVMKQEQCALIIIFLRWAAGSLICCLIREIFGVDSVVKTPGDLPLSRNPLSVELLTLFRMSQSALQVIWNLGGRAKMCCGIFRKCEISLVFSLMAQLLGWKLSLVPTLPLLPQVSFHFIIWCSMFESSTLSAAFYNCILVTKRKNAAKNRKHYFIQILQVFLSLWFYNQKLTPWHLRH